MNAWDPPPGSPAAPGGEPAEDTGAPPQHGAGPAREPSIQHPDSEQDITPGEPEDDENDGYVPL